MSEIQARVLVALNHPMANVIPHTALVTYTMIPATYTGSSSEVLAVAVVLDYQIITATTPHALITHISVPAIGTENQSMLLTVATLSGHLMATAITFHVHTNTKVLATFTVYTSVVVATVVGLDYTVTASTLHALVTHILVSAICTEKQWVVRRIAPVSGHRMITVITLHVHITNTKVFVTNTEKMSVFHEVAVVASD